MEPWIDCSFLNTRQVQSCPIVAELLENKIVSLRKKERKKGNKKILEGQTDKVNQMSSVNNDKEIEQKKAIYFVKENHNLYTCLL